MIALEDLGELRGSQLPRIGTPRRVSLQTYGTAAGALMDVLGVQLLPWQQHTLDVGLEVEPSGLWRSATNVVVVARQNGKSRGILIPRIALELFVFAGGVVHLAQDRALPREHFEELTELITAVPELSRQIKRLRLANGQEELRLHNGATYRLKAPTGKASRGATVTLLVWDELREQRDSDAWSASIYTQRAVPNPQLWAVSNAGDPESLILNRMRDRGRLAAEDPGSDRRMTYLEWSARPDRRIDDVDGWVEANPSLGYFLRAEALVDELDNDDEVGFRTEGLCQWVDVATSLVVDADRWRECALGMPDREDGSRPWLAVDIDPEQLRAVIVAAAWHSGRLVIEVVDHWDDGPVSEEAVANRVAEWFRSLRARAVAYDPHTTQGVADRLTRLTDRQLRKVTGVEWYTAVRQLRDQVQQLAVWHPDDPILSGDILGAARRDVGDGSWTMSRRHSAQSIPAATAAARAVHLAVTPEPVPSIG